jgi:hypothetical protein
MWQDIPLGTMDHSSSSTWLPEPSAPDDTYARRDEHALDWLARSTIARAKTCRRFLNEHLAKLLLAVQASGISSEFEDFDMALFGRGYDRFNERRRLVGTGFAPDGIFNEKRDKTPTFAGVLAFLTIGFNACTAPILYRHPRFSGVLPKAILQLEQRVYNEESNKIQIRSSKAQGLGERLSFVNV